MTKQLTIRGVTDGLASRLESLAADRDQSVNAVVLEILESAMGIEGRRDRLRRYATWTESDLAEVEKAIAAQRTIDDDLWR